MSRTPSPRGVYHALATGLRLRRTLAAIASVDESGHRVPTSFPDVGTYKGEELRDWMREWARTWQDNRFEMLDFTDHGDAGLIKSRWHLAAPGSEARYPSRTSTQADWLTRQSRGVCSLLRGLVA